MELQGRCSRNAVFSRDAIQCSDEKRRMVVESAIPFDAMCQWILPSTQQRLSFQNGSPNEVSLVLAKNIAETCSKINDVISVMDCGKGNETKVYALKTLNVYSPSGFQRLMRPFSLTQPLVKCHVLQPRFNIN